MYDLCKYDHSNNKKILVKTLKFGWKVGELTCSSLLLAIPVIRRLQRMFIAGYSLLIIAEMSSSESIVRNINE